jgi:dsRNA-specific ribonuclease
MEKTTTSLGANEVNLNEQFVQLSLTPKSIINYDVPQQQLEYQFHNLSLLIQALTRRSALVDGHSSSNAKDYQQLEFLGDRVLNLAICQILMEHFPNCNEEDISAALCFLVANATVLPGVGRQLKLENYLRKGNSESVVTDKMYADAVEAVLGAIFLDCGKIGVIRQIIEKFWQASLLVFTQQRVTTNIDHVLGAHSVVTAFGNDVTLATPTNISSSSSSSSSEHYENGDYIFRKEVLNWPLSKLESPLPSLQYTKPLPEKESSATRNEYYEKFHVLIKEEARASLQQGYEDYKLGRAEYLTLVSKKFKQAKNEKNPSVFVMEGKLPRNFEYGNSSIAVLLKPIDVKDNDADFPLLGLAACQEDASAEERVVKFEIKVSVNSTISVMHANSFSGNVKWYAYVLGSLVSHIRMYDVCTKMPHFLLLDQIICGNLPPLPKVLPSFSLQDEKYLAKLNISQKEAVGKFIVLEQGLQLLQGPPGTGKTTAIITLLELLSLRKDRVLVCAPSNKAVQVIAERFFALHPEIPMVLVGVKSHLQHKLQAIFLHDFGWDIQNKTNELIEIVNELKNLDIFVKIEHVTHFLNKLHVIVMLSKEIEQKLKIYAPIFLSIFAIVDIFTSIKLLTTIVKNQSDNANAAIKSTLNDIFLTLNVTLTHISKLTKIDTQEGGSPLEVEVLQHAKVIFSTLCVTGRKAMQNLKSIDILIVDEAGQAVETETLIPFALNPSKCLLVGDTKQLPATVLSPCAVNLHFDWSLMFRLLEKCKQPYNMLTMQYRMDPEIRKWPSQQYYGDALVDAASVSDYRHTILKDYPVIFGPCSFINIAYAKEDIARYSYANQTEAMHVLQIMKYLKNIKHVDLNTQVGIITFYAGQVDLLERNFRQDADCRNLKACTVDGFQGDEKDFIIISFVRANPKGKIGFLQDFRRLNVAATRAKAALIMLGNIDTLIVKNSDLANLIDNLRIRNRIWQEKDLIGTINIAFNPTYKTQLCRYFFTTGNCKYGDECGFAHSKDELRLQGFSVSSQSMLVDPYIQLTDSIGYQFQNRTILTEALTRQSAINENLRSAAKQDNQKLKILGDRVLKVIIAKSLIENFPALVEGELHNCEAELLAKEQTLYTIAQTIKLQNYLIRGCGESDLTPKVLADALKALIGAVYCDAKDLTQVIGVVHKLWIDPWQKLGGIHKLQPQITQSKWQEDHSSSSSSSSSSSALPLSTAKFSFMPPPSTASSKVAVYRPPKKIFVSYERRF